MFEKEAEELFKKKPLGYEMKLELEIYTDGFNDGYQKANEWHDLRKNPEDTPDYEAVHYVLIDDGGKAYYDKTRKVWRDLFDCIRFIPMAWREIPVFKGD